MAITCEEDEDYGDNENQQSSSWIDDCDDLWTQSSSYIDIESEYDEDASIDDPIEVVKT